MEKWWQKSVVYEIYIRSFKDSNHDGIGDINGIIEKLDYLQYLGVDVLWITPIYDTPNDDNGYDISDYCSIMNMFGTMQDFEMLLAQAHRRNMRILMDLVVNHTSDEHPWFIESRKNKENKYRDYYIWRDGKDNGDLPNNWTSSFLGPAWEFDEARKQYYLHLFSKKQPDLNWDNPVVRNEIFELMKWWLDKGIDGFRMDVISLISKDQDNLYQDSSIKGHSVSANGPSVHEYMKEMNKNVFSSYDMMSVGETPAVTVDEAIQYAHVNGSELDMVFQFELMDVDGGESGKWNDQKYQLLDVKKVLRKWQKGLYQRAWNSLFWNNHDQPRVVSRFGDTSTSFYWEKSSKMLATALYFLQGTPYIYQGEELGITNVEFTSIDEFCDIESIHAYKQYVDIEKSITQKDMLRYLNKSSRDHARTPMQWDDRTFAGFSDVTPWIKVNSNYKQINAKDQISDKNSIFHYYRKLIKIVKENEVVQLGDYKEYYEEHPEIYVYERTYGKDALYVLCNFSSKEVSYDQGILPLNSTCLLSNYDHIILGKLRAYEAIVLTSTKEEK